MRKDEFPSYKVVEKGSIKILMQLKLMTGQYQAVCVGTRGIIAERFWFCGMNKTMESCLG